tara:strand:+ start:850 stop:1344 length:495 start_codon:yes stop_codon:yes gene_type:complete
MPSLYELTKSTEVAINEMMALEDVPQEVINDTIEGLQGELEVKQKGVAAYILNRGSDINAMKEYKNNMDIRIRKAEKQIESLKTALLWSFTKHHIDKLDSPELSVKLKNNPPSVVINNEGLIPENYLRKKIVTTVDKAAIKGAINSGEDIPGAHLESKQRIEIK